MQILYSQIYTTHVWKYIHKKPRTMVLSALYLLASTTTLITVSTVEPLQLQRQLQEQGWT